jgi:hypothetical protein
MRRCAGTSIRLLKFLQASPILVAYESSEHGARPTASLAKKVR